MAATVLQWVHVSGEHPQACLWRNSLDIGCARGHVFVGTASEPVLGVSGRPTSRPLDKASLPHLAFDCVSVAAHHRETANSEAEPILACKPGAELTGSASPLETRQVGFVVRNVVHL